MAVITPNSDVILLKVPLEISDSNQLTFANATAQYNYFNSLPKVELEKYTYQRKDGTIRVGMLVDDLYEYNYVMYRNTNHNDKWFYAFITNVAYVGDSVSAVSIKTDVWQTYQFDLTFKPTFVEREHVNDDTIGIHTVPEGLETGEFVRGLTGAEYSYTNFWLAFQVTELISNMSLAFTSANSRLYNGIYNGLYIILTDNYLTADLLVAAYDDAGKADAIVSCFYVPKELVPSTIINSGITLHGQQRDIYFPAASNNAINIARFTVNLPTTIDGYTPKNNKLFTSEYCYMLASNNCGSEAIFNFEDFRQYGTNNLITPEFYVDGALSQGCSIKLFPSNIDYKAPVDAVADYTSYQAVAKYGIPAGKLPVCSWNSDSYTNWLTQNAVNVGTGIAGGVAAGIVSASYGNLVGAGMSIIGSITSNLAKVHQASLMPDQAKGNVNSGDINFSSGVQFTVTTMTIRKEYAKIIDDYFSMFGYKVNEVKTPNITGRTNWNYVKTIGCYIEAHIPQEDLAEIKAMFDKGVTFWHNPSTFADYSQTNGIVV